MNANIRQPALLTPTKPSAPTANTPGAVHTARVMSPPRAQGANPNSPKPSFDVGALRPQATRRASIAGSATDSATSSAARGARKSTMASEDKLKQWTQMLATSKAQVAKTVASSSLAAPAQPAVKGAPVQAAARLDPTDVLRTNRSIFKKDEGSSTDESVERVRTRHRVGKRLPRTLSATEFDLLVEELTRRRKTRVTLESEFDKAKVNRILKMSDNDFLDIVLALKDERVAAGRAADNGSALRMQSTPTAAAPASRLRSEYQGPQKMEAPTGTSFHPAVWSAPLGKLKAPGVYLDDALLKTGVNHPVHSAKAMLATGPFGVGEAKACLDDLQSHLLSYYGNVYKIQSDLPLDWQLEQLRRSYYPSPVPLSPGAPNTPLSAAGTQRSGKAEGAAGKDSGGGGPPSVGPKGIQVNPEDRGMGRPTANSALRDAAKTRFPSAPKEEAKAKKPMDAGPRKETAAGGKDGGGKDAGAGSASSAKKADGSKNNLGLKVPGDPVGLPNTVPSVKREMSGVMQELVDLASGNGDRLDRMVSQLQNEVYDPSSRGYWRSSAMRKDRLASPRYIADRPYVEYLESLEEDTEKMYRNLRVTTDYNNKKIKLLQDRLRIIKHETDARDAS